MAFVLGIDGIDVNLTSGRDNIPALIRAVQANW